MKYLSVCSGVEAASQAWQPLGWEAVAFSEIEPFPCAVLASRFPNVPNLGDMSKIHYNKETKELTNGTTTIVCRDGIDLLVGGTPCQSFSVAGKRAGLEGASGLAYHYARLIGEIRPRWFVWENVPGALSSVTYGDQRDFNFLLQQFGIGGNADLGVRYNLCWRVLDTQYVRVEPYPRAIPQRRRRVFIVGHLATDCGGGCEVLLEPEGVRGNPPPRRVKGQGVAGDTAAGAGGADGEKRVSIGADIIGGENVYGSCDSIEHTQPLRRQPWCRTGVISKAVSFKGGQSADGGLCVDEGACQTILSHMIALEPTVAIRTANTHANGQAVAFKLDATASNSMKSANPHSGIHKTEVHCALDTTDPNPTKAQGGMALCVPVAMRGNRTPTDRGKFPETDGSGAAYSLTSVQTVSMVATAIGIDPYNSASTGDVSKTLNTAVAQDTDHTGAVAIGIDSYNLCGTGDVAMTVHGTKQYAEHMPAVAIGINGDCAGTLDSNYFKGFGERQGTEREVVAIGIGRDAFNSGKNAQMAQSFSTEVQPPITAKGPGGGMHQWRTTNGEDVMPTLDTRLAAQVDKQMERNGSYLCGPMQ